MSQGWISERFIRQRISYAAIPLFLLLLSYLIISCDNQPPPPQPPATIEIWQNKKLIFSRDVAAGQPFGAGNTELNSAPLLALFDPVKQKHPMSVRLFANPKSATFNTQFNNQPGPDVTLRSQVELHVFARDPTEVFFTLVNLGDNDPLWRQNTLIPLPANPTPGNRKGLCIKRG